MVQAGRFGTTSDIRDQLCSCGLLVDALLISPYRKYLGIGRLASAAVGQNRPFPQVPNLPEEAPDAGSILMGKNELRSWAVRSLAGDIAAVMGVKWV